MQKHITADGLKLLWHEKWYSIHVWRHRYAWRHYIMINL